MSSLHPAGALRPRGPGHSTILPNVINPVIVLASLSPAGAILAEAGLRFLGVGVQPPTPSGSPAENNAQPTVLSPRASLHRTASLLRG